MKAVNRTVSFITIGICALLSLWYYLNPIFKPQSTLVKSATLVSTTNPVTDFQLVDTNGNVFNQHNLRGHWTLMFFGYTDCPVICPITLNAMRDTWNNFNEQPPVNFVFASINSENDTPEALKKFLNSFHSKFTGITGMKTEMNKLSDQLGIFVAKSGEFDGKGHEIIDHTAALMLINPQAKLHAVFTSPLEPAVIAKDLNTLTKTKSS